MTGHVANYSSVLKDYSEPFLRSLMYAGLATAFCILLGYPLAYAIAFKAGRWKNLMLVAVIAPFFTSFLIRTLSWQLLLADQGWIVQTLQFLHLLGADGHLLATPVAVVTGLTYNFLPFMVLPLYASLEKIDVRLLEAGSDLYASPFTTFRTVTLPLSMPGLVGGTLLTFSPAAGDYINAELLGNTQTQMIGNVIQKLFDGGSYPEAAALSVTLMAVIVVLVLLYVKRAGTEELL
jgi:spermidine/putrescine transport system permease protein